MRVLALGDIVGRPGRTMVLDHIGDLLSQYNPDFVLANGENAASGMGITRDTADELFACGIDVLTMGNHVWDKKEVFDFIDDEPRILRPLNYPEGTPGRGFGIFKAAGSLHVGVISLAGRVFSPAHLDCPFRLADRAISILSQDTPIIILDFHAEATSEKIALAWYLDGRVSAVLGTHTHVQTADEQVLPSGTGYITDLGMTGPSHSVIGVKTDLVLRHFLTQLPTRFEVARGPRILCGVIVDIDDATGKCRHLSRIFLSDNTVC